MDKPVTVGAFQAALQRNLLQQFTPLKPQLEIQVKLKLMSLVASLEAVQRLP